MAHGVGHCHCAHSNLSYCSHCDVAYCNNCKREWGWRLGGWTWYSQQPYNLTSGTTNAYTIQATTASEGGHTHG